MMDLAIVAGFGGVGFTRLVKASPLGQLRFKPFSCATCLSGWGAILTGGVALMPPGTPFAAWLTLALAGTGIAAVILDALTLAREATARLAIPPDAGFAAADLPPIETADT